MPLRNPFTRRAEPPAAEGRPTTGRFLREESHRDFMYATDHVLPQGTVNRGDELVWVATRIELHATAGDLDEGTPHVLDAEINHRNAQWDDAVGHEAAHRMRTAKALHAEEAEHLTALLEELRTLRSAAARAATEDDHWRAVLNGAPLTDPPVTGHDLVAPASSGITLAVPTTAVGPAPWAAATANPNTNLDDINDNDNDTDTTTDTEGVLP